ncbi:MAG: TIGR02444 family protein [Confluentimicrobium sp.]|nr:TIGR02444 family protein [Actibacterium sp.]
MSVPLTPPNSTILPKPSTPTGDTPFWAFSLDRYGRDGVAPLCLLLQDRHGADVNLVLLGLWLGSDRRRIADAAAGERIAGAVGAWHDEVVRPLRAARGALKGRSVRDVDARDVLRASIQRSELAAEKMEQDMLHDLIVAMPELCRPAGEERARIMAANAAFFCGPAADGTPPDALLLRLAELCVQAISVRDR